MAVIQFPLKLKKVSTAHDPDQLSLFLVVSQDAYGKAEYCDSQGDYEEARKFYLEAIDEGINVADAYCNLGWIEYLEGRIAEALDCFTAALYQNPGHLQSHYNLAALYYEQHDCWAASIHFAYAGYKEPRQFPRAFYFLGHCEREIGFTERDANRFDAAIEAYKKFMELRPSDAVEVPVWIEQLCEAREKFLKNGRPITSPAKGR